VGDQLLRAEAVGDERGTGEVTDENGAHFLRDYVAESREFVVRVRTVLPRQA
jgi:hypothetical protein